MSAILFYVISAVIILAALAVVRAPNIFHAGLSMAMTFGAVAGIYALLEAHFVAAVQVLIYVGAIAVILKFAVMLTQHIGQHEQGAPMMHHVSAAVLCALFAVLAIKVIRATQWGGSVWNYVSAKDIGECFLFPGKYGYLVPFEMVGVLLLMALVGAAMVATREER